MKAAAKGITATTPNSTNASPALILQSSKGFPTTKYIGTIKIRPASTRLFKDINEINFMICKASGV
jgi:hypothetical protein